MSCKIDELRDKTMRIKPTSAYENMWIYYVRVVVNLLHVSVTSCDNLQEGVFFSQGILQLQPSQYTKPFHLPTLFIWQ